MLNKCLLVLIVFCIAFGFVSGVAAEGKNEEGNKVGGNLKFFLYDRSEGESNGVKGGQPGINGFVSLYLYISKELNDKVSVEVEPSISASAGATPKFGAAIGSQLVASPAASISFVRALVKTALPNGYELSAGMLHPLFTEDYGAQIWYEEEFIGNYVSANSYLGEMTAEGLEFYKNFELNKVSVPAYLYVVNGNGNRYVDNNNDKGIMIHVAPEFGNIRLMASVFTAKYDAEDKYINNRMSGGLAYEQGNFMFRTEYMTGTWEHKELYADTTLTNLTKDFKTLSPSGYYAKIGYRVTSWARLLLSYSAYSYNFTGVTKTIGGKPTSAQAEVGETYSNISPIVNLYASPDSIIFLQYLITNYNTADNSNKLSYNRFVCGWRTTF